jgi:peroxiredoxin/predicted 2-oxoglutarate/Fe(II)-dependent dioxygenase YbiX
LKGNFMLNPGDPAPWFEAASSVNPKFVFDTAAGRYIVLTFFGSAAHPASRIILDEFERNQARFDVLNAAFLGVSADPDDQRLARVRQQFPGVIYLWDFDRAVASLYQVSKPGASDYFAQTLILDPALRIIGVFPFDDNPQAHAGLVLRVLNQFPLVTALTAFAPVLEIPFVFEPPLCAALIQLHQQHGGTEIGVLREIDGQTVRVNDRSHKRRTDYMVSDPSVTGEIESRLRRRVFPEIKKAFQYQATQIERYIVSCYDADAGGYFRAHRDDITKGSAHRRFALSINLDTEQYEGGELRFPEYGFRTYRAPSGSAIVFSCSLLHEVRPVTKGRRYAFLPFIFDDQAARIREENLKYVAADLRQV